MKRTSLIAATILLAFTGCRCGQGWSCWRPNLLGRLHDKIHGTNVGAPCASGVCATGPVMAAPAPVMADGGCQDCGPGVHAMGYEGYPASASYGGEIVGGAYDNVVGTSPVYAAPGGATYAAPSGSTYSSVETVPSVRAN